VRWYLLLPLLGCAAADSDGPVDSYDTMRDRLAAENTRFLISAQSTGDVLGRRWVHDHWEEMRVPLTIASGDLRVSAKDGALRLDRLAVNFAPITIPDAVFEQPASLSNAKIGQTAMAQVNPVWGGPDLANASFPLNLEISWSVDVSGGGAPQPFEVALLAVPVDLEVKGNGDHIDATLAVRVHGTVWSLAQLYELADATLSLSAATVD